MGKFESGPAGAGGRSFASILSSLTPAQRQTSTEREPSGDERLAEDVLRLSYDHALLSRSISTTTAVGVDSKDGSIGHDPQTKREAESFGTAPTESPKATRKTSSITVRLTETECERLHARAAEAGLTVSAYLRSCAFEVESLRAQVKDALAQIRQPLPAQDVAAAQPERAAMRWLPRWAWRHHVAHA